MPLVFLTGIKIKKKWCITFMSNNWKFKTYNDNKIFEQSYTLDTKKTKETSNEGQIVYRNGESKMNRRTPKLGKETHRSWPT
jgi:hypothetical protein